MTGSGSGAPEAQEEKRLNDDLVVFMRKRSETEAPRYTARLKTYIDLRTKRRRAVAARRNGSKRKQENELKDKVPVSGDAVDEAEPKSRRTATDKSGNQSRSISGEQSDAACGRRRRRKRSCGRRRRRRSRRGRSSRRRRRSSRRRRSRSRRRRGCSLCRRSRRRRRRC